MFARLRKTTEENEGGFTLIELLVVVIIIGILAAIAIPTFLNQRERGWDANALSDLKQAQVALETCASAQGGLYLSAATGGVDCKDTMAANGLRQSENVTTTATTSATAYTITSKHASGPTTYAYNSATGKIVGTK